MIRVANVFDKLKNKPQPKKKMDIFVQPPAAAPLRTELPQEEKEVPPPPADEEHPSSEQESPDTDISTEEIETQPQAREEPAAAVASPNIVDLRTDVMINRKLILERLRKIERPIEQPPPPPPTAEVNIAPAITVEPPPPATIKRRGKKIILQDVAPAAAAPEPAAAPAQEEGAPAPIIVRRPRGRKTKAPPVKEVIVDIEKITIGNTILGERIPRPAPLALHRLNSYYMANRKMFLTTINKLFAPYEEELKTVEQFSCDQKESGDFVLLTHQKVVRDYLNLYTPYRGLLLYHGLGSGKTCTSIAIAEGMKTQRRIIIMTPASLKMNYFSELKKCGDEMYKRTQYWEFVSTDGHPEYVDILSYVLSISPDYIRQKHGAWLVNIKRKEENFSKLHEKYQRDIDEQLNQMILSKYTSINYNGLNERKIDALTMGGTINPFDNAVVVIDEAHNFVSRIVNKLKQKTSISYRLYDYLMSAENVRVVLLTGTPIINYPNEIAVLFNILRGYIKTWEFKVTSTSRAKLNENTIYKILADENIKTYDYLKFSGNQLTITRNPFGFSNTKKPGRAAATAADDLFEKYGGITLDEKNAETDREFIENVVAALKKHNLNVGGGDTPEPTNYTPLPHMQDDFMAMFLSGESQNVQNLHVFKKRILGLTSYFRSAQEQLLPKYNRHSDFHLIKCPMSDYQFDLYATVRGDEIAREKKQRTKRRTAAAKKLDDLYKETSSTYRIMSRAACNFVFPEDIERPMPAHGGVGAATAAAAAAKQQDDTAELVVEFEEDDIDPQGINEAGAEPGAETPSRPIASKIDPTYMPRIKAALKELNDRATTVFSPEGLATYSPKFLNVLENLKDENNIGNHLVYTAFRTVEGIEILKMILLANGFAEFKVRRDESTGEWEIIQTEDDIGKPRFALYTGTETEEEKELLRNIYNGDWGAISPNLYKKLTELSPNNLYGEIIKVFMITAAGSEGISLKNTRYVHILESYWHPVRAEQVIGRARRICSHQDLPTELRNVKVFMYLATFTPEQEKTEKYLELRTFDRSKDPKVLTPITSDEYLYEISNIKSNITQQFLRAIKETAIDCRLYNKRLGDSGEQLTCYGTVNVKTNAFMSYPNIDVDAEENVEDINVKKVAWSAVEIKYRGARYALREDTGELYDINDYQDLAEGRVLDIKPIGIIKKNAAGRIVAGEFY
jgi:hypothetical protein